MKSYLQLKAYRNQLVKDAAKLLLNDRNHDIGNDISRIENYDILLSMLSWRKLQDFLLAALVAGICMGTMWFLWSSKVATNRVLLNVQTKYVRFNLAEKPQTFDQTWVWEGNLAITPDKGLRLKNLTPDEVALRYIKKSGRNLYLHSGIGNVGLRELRADVDGALTIEYNENDSVELAYDGQAFSGMLFFQKDGNNLVSSIPEDGSFKWEHGSGPRPRMEMVLLEDWDFFNIPIKGISFVRGVQKRSDPGEQPVESELIHGVLQYAEIGLKWEFGEGDTLDLQGMEGRLVSVHIQKKEKIINLRYEGQVKKIVRGPKGFDKNITPSILEYWFYKKSLAFFASVFISLMGFLWSLRKWLIA